MVSSLAAQIAADVERLCSPGDRSLGTERNRAATRYVMARMRGMGLATRSIGFEVPEWRAGAASVEAAGRSVPVQPGPFSPGLRAAEGRLVLVRQANDIPDGPVPDAVLLLLGEIAATQFTPRGYPFYSDAEHAAILDALEASQCLAVLAATTKSAMTGAMSPFPLIEDVSFCVPSAYMTAETGEWLAGHEGKMVGVSIDSEVAPSNGEQPVGRHEGPGADWIVVSAHVDSKPGTPGAIDNAAGVAVLLAAAQLALGASPARTLEFVPFNGEDHVLAPGELAWLAGNPRLDDVRLTVNIDAPGLPGGPSAYSLYGVGETAGEVIARLASEFPDVTEGPPWPASDHMVFAMRGVPAVAVTSSDFATASGEYSHTPADVPAILDYEVLAGTARFVAALISAT